MRPKLPIARAAGAAAAAMLCATPALAQSSVTLFGVVDTNMTVGRGSVANRSQLGSSGDASSRLGFRGLEDLGGGRSLGFWLEAGIATDTGLGAATNSNNQATGAVAAGALLFNRRSTISLSGTWGELRLGRYLTPHFLNLTVFDPFTATGLGTTQTLNSGLAVTGPAAVRASNAIGYILPAGLGGFYGEAMAFLGENVKNGAATEDDGNGVSTRFGWRSGAFNAALSIGRIEYATTAAAGDVDIVNVGASYNFGSVQLMGHYVRDRMASTVAREGRGGLIGVIVPVGAGLVRAAYSTYKTEQGAAASETRKMAVAYVHNLSKRTAVYGTLARLSNSGGATQALGGAVTAANASSTGYELGIRHSF